MDRIGIAVLGAGIAGASTAYFLARRGIRSVCLFEREKDPGSHATGRNAAILRSAIQDPALHRLARESTAFFREPPAGFAAHALLRPVGLYLAAPEGHAQALSAWAERPECQQGLERADPAELRRRVPPLADGIEVVYRQADEGVLDVHALLEGFLHGARAGGAEVAHRTRVREIRHDGRRVLGLDTDRGPVDADKVVLACGAWSGELAATAGCELPLTTLRRHLLVTEPCADVDPDWPVVWISGDEFYFRPESGGLLVSPCDTAAVPPDRCEAVDDSMKELAAVKTGRWLPALVDAGAAHFWSGGRTFAPDKRFLVGADPRLEGLYWVAGLGGHGITTAPAVGALAAEWIAEGGSGHPAAPDLAPARLLGLSEAAS